MKKNAYVIRHVAFEDLGNLASVLQENNYAINYFEAGCDDLSMIINKKPDLLVILGGPIGVYDDDLYPFLQMEIEILKTRIKDDLPTLGICLGAQLIAATLGSKVFSGHQKEIGWSKLFLNTNAKKNYFRHLDELEVLHWHGDTFDLPEKAFLQASTKLYENQAFTYGNNILALQFHLEVIENNMEKWLIGHANEINNNKINISHLRTDTKKYAKKLKLSAQKFWGEWLNKLDMENRL